VNKRGLWDSGFVEARGWGDPWFSWEDVIVWIIFCAGKEVKHLRLRMRWGTASLVDVELVRWGALPAGWEAYLARAGEPLVMPLGPLEAQRYQSSTWNFSPCCALCQLRGKAQFLAKSYDVYLYPQLCTLFICLLFVLLNLSDTHFFSGGKKSQNFLWPSSTPAGLDHIFAVGLKGHRVPQSVMLLLHPCDFLMLKTSRCFKLSSRSVHPNPLDASVLIMH